MEENKNISIASPKANEKMDQGLKEYIKKQKEIELKRKKGIARLKLNVKSRQRTHDENVAEQKAINKYETEVLEYAKNLQTEYDKLPNNDKLEFMNGNNVHKINYNDIAKQMGYGNFASISKSNPKVGDIIDNIPARTYVQLMIAYGTENTEYKLLRFLSNREFVTLGSLDKFYNDKKDAVTNVAGLEKVVIGDFNYLRNAAFTKNFKVDRTLAVQYSLLDTRVNDFAFSLALFIALIRNEAMMNGEPIKEGFYNALIETFNELGGSNPDTPTIVNPQIGT